MKSATPSRYTTTSFRVSAATAKNSEPSTKIWMTVIDSSGWTYHHRWFGPMRATSVHGAYVPNHMPTDTPENTNTQVTNEAAHRPPRYANFEIGFVNSIWYVSRWKSRRIDGPKMAEMMITPNSAAASWLNATAYGP